MGESAHVRQRIHLYGAVQGVGFRPFVFRLATELGLAGEVSNSGAGAWVELEGSASDITAFGERLISDKPAACLILATEITRLDPTGRAGFHIVPSETGTAKTAVVLPDLATCPECLAEIQDPGARRYAYPFTNCTNCGPRFTIVRGIPYDRPNTTMAGFPLCPDCRAEYEAASDRRFHAQPIACPKCGPQLDHTISEIAQSLSRGEIVALKGIGGFQLLCDARSSSAVQRLRQRKHREEKPFAVMFPSLSFVQQCCEIGEVERRILESSASPIVLLRKRADAAIIAPEVCMASPWVGAMIPYSPLHHLLLRECGFPLVATSGNLSDEPIAIDNEDALQRLGGIADVFASHNRPIERPCDDSVVRVQIGHEIVMRRARGYAPLPVLVRQPLPRILAVGGHLKNTVAIAVGRQIFLSQHIGDLETTAAFGAFRSAIAALSELYEFQPELVACDLHPDYASTGFAETLGLPLVRVQHHQAHVAACAAENDIAGPYLGVAWDGTGYGTDGTIWGSEFFAVSEAGIERVAHLVPFRLPGGEGAVRDCRRTALSLLHDAGLDPALSGLSPSDTQNLRTMLQRCLNSPVTTSMGRLFDAAAALSGVATRNGFEGQAPMLFESAIHLTGEADAYPLDIDGSRLDWRPTIGALVQDKSRCVVPGDISRRFHNTMASAVVSIAQMIGIERVVLSGGVFQNSYLAERAVRLLREAGFRAYTHQRVPPNDGGIALGQAVLAAAAFRKPAH